MTDKERLIRKYGLVLENHAWYSIKENAYKQLIFKESFVERVDVLGMLFRINKLCAAKMKYFRLNIGKYQPLKYHYKDGFVRAPLWDAEFFGHDSSGYILDLRYLQSITALSDFEVLCRELESYEE